MVKRGSHPPPAQRPLRLLVPHADARDRLQQRIEKAGALKEPVQSRDTFKTREHDYNKWNDYNKELLRQLFSDTDPLDDYSRTPSIALLRLGPDLSGEIDDLFTTVDERVHRLQSLIERLELIPLSDEISTRLDTLPSSGQDTQLRQVFVVHGHDEGALEAVARFLERLDFEPVILHEQASMGMTLMEKLERYADVGFAVVLLTPDDEGRKIDTKDPLNPRARQNVVLELGYFIARLGRSHVCALYKATVDLPSDFLGVVFVPLDDGGGWKLLLAKELRAAKFSVDMNKAVD